MLYTVQIIVRLCLQLRNVIKICWLKPGDFRFQWPVTIYLHKTSLTTEIIVPSRHLCSHMTSWSHSYIGNIAILTESSGQIEVLFIVSITWSCAFEIKIFLLLHLW